MLLAVDIGNTNIAFGTFDDDNLSFMARVSTVTSATEDEYAIKLMDILSIYGIDTQDITGAIISSVVPQLNTVMKRAIHLATGADALLVGPGVKTGLSIRCDNPASVGADIISESVGVAAIYGYPALIIDMGTATKITVLDKTGAFVGLSIMPGVQMGINALSRGTAQLPQVSLDAPPTVIGKNTVDCMRSGAIFGNASMIDGMIDRIIEETGESYKLIATGGLAYSVIPYSKHSFEIDKHIVLRGLNIIYNKTKT